MELNYSEQYRGRVRILWLSSPDDFHQTFHPHQLLQRKAEVLDIIGDWNQAEAIHRYSLELAEVQKDERLQAEGQVLLAGVLFKKGRYSETYDLLGKALKYYERVDDQQAVGRILAEIGNVHRAQGDYDRAMEFYQRHLKIAEALEDNYAISQTVGNMGNIYRVRGQHAQALAYTLKFLQNAQELGDKRNLGVAYGVLGNIYRHQGLLDKAMEVYRRQLVIMTELGDIRSRTYALGNVGRIYLLQYNYPMAREYYSRHLALAEELGDKRSISFAEGSLGGLYKALLAFPKALNHYQRAIDLCRELKLRPELAENLNQMVELFLLQGKAGQAKQLNAEALEVAAEIGKQEIKFASRLLQARIAAQSDRTAAEGMMRALVDDRLNHSQTAEVCYQLFKLTGDFDDKRKARVAYQSAYNAAPDLAVRLRLEELTEME